MSKVLLYKGRRGSGKTLSMVKDGYQYLQEGYKVLRNFSCSFGEHISEEEILNLDKRSVIKDCVLMIDEIQIFFDSRRSMKKENTSFSNFIQQIRKRNITLLCTTQYSNTIDLRLRQHIDIMAYPNFKEKYDVCEVVYLDLTALEDSLFNEDNESNYLKLIYNAIPVYSLFKTEEMIR